MDLLERLADVSVPPVPAAGTLGATAWAARHMLIALFAALVYTVSGRWPRSAKRIPPARD
jgi:hypothetical protein